MSMGRAPKQNETRNVVKDQLKTDVRTNNSHTADKFYHDADAMMIEMLSLMSMSGDEDDDGNDDVNANSSKVLTMADRLNNKLNYKSSNLIFSKISFQSIFQNQINFRNKIN